MAKTHTQRYKHCTTSRAIPDTLASRLNSQLPKKARSCISYSISARPTVEISLFSRNQRFGLIRAAGYINPNRTAVYHSEAIRDKFCPKRTFCASALMSSPASVSKAPSSNTIASNIVCDAMQKIAPLSLAESWDNVGLLLEAPKPRPGANGVLLTIDLTTAVMKEALESAHIGMIVVYHPTLFRPISSLTLSNPLQRSLLQCAAAGISLYSPHTALDCVKDGVNDWLALGVLGYSPEEASSRLLAGSLERDERTAGLVTILGEEKGGGAGLGRLVKLDAGIDINDLAKRIKKFLALEHVQVASPTFGATRSESPSVVSSIAICAGSGGSVLDGVAADAYFTGEMPHHEVLAAVASGSHVILCGHTNTERGYLPILARKLTAELAIADNGPYTVGISQADFHPLHFV